LKASFGGGRLDSLGCWGKSAVDLTIAFSDRPALTSARQVEVLREHIAGVTIACMVAFAAPAAATTASIGIATVAVIGRSRIVSVPHGHRCREEHHEIVVTLATSPWSMRTLVGSRNRPLVRLRGKTEA
jgi:hypothetical protein